MWSYGDSGVDDEEDLMSVKGFDCGGDGHKLYFWFKKGCGKLQEVKVLLNNTLIAWKNMTVLAGLSPDYVLSVDPECKYPRLTLIGEALFPSLSISCLRISLRAPERCERRLMGRLQGAHDVGRAEDG